MSAPGASVILRTTGVSKSFGKFLALNNITAEFERGAITSIIGPNGAGKSTYFNLLSGAFAPTRGKVEFEGRDVTHLPQHRFAHLGIAKSFQITNIFPQLSVRENVRVGLQAFVSRYDIWRPRASLPGLIEQADGLLAMVGLQDRRERRARDLAHGEQRALEIGMALAANPRLLLLDEPTGGMSLEERRVTGELLQPIKAQCSLVIVEHDLDFIRDICDRLTVLDQGRVLESGTVPEIQASKSVQEIYLRRA